MRTTRAAFALGLLGLLVGCTQPIDALDSPPMEATSRLRTTAVFRRADSMPWGTALGGAIHYGAPDTLYISVGDFPPGCGEPLGEEVTNPACPVLPVRRFDWWVELAIPPELAHPGVIALDDPRILELLEARFPPESAAERACGHVISGPFFNKGTLEIVEIDPIAISVRFHDTIAPDVAPVEPPQGGGVPAFERDEHQVISGPTFTASFCL